MSDSLQQLVGALRAEVRSLRQEVASLRQAVDATQPPSIEPVMSGSVAGRALEARDLQGGKAAAAASTDPPLQRRTLLSAGAAALAGTVAGTSAAVLSTPSPASAANGDAVTCGQTKTASSATELRYNGAAMVDWNLFTVQDTTNTQTNFPSAICGMASSDVSYGVQGYTSVDDAAGVLAYGGSTSYGLYARGGRANMIFRQAGADPKFRNDFHQAGELLASSSGGLWYCDQDGSPGQWTCLAGPGRAGGLELLDSPIRVYDSRPNYPPAGGTKGALSGAERVVDCGMGGDGAPLGDANAVLINLTVVNTSVAGWMALYDAGLVEWPGTSSINWYQAGSVVANLAIVKCNVQALIRAKVPVNSSTHFLVDLIGWFS